MRQSPGMDSGDGAVARTSMASRGPRIQDRILQQVEEGGRCSSSGVRSRDGAAGLPRRDGSRHVVGNVFMERAGRARWIFDFGRPVEFAQHRFHARRMSGGNSAGAIEDDEMRDVLKNGKLSTGRRRNTDGFFLKGRRRRTRGEAERKFGKPETGAKGTSSPGKASSH